MHNTFNKDKIRKYKVNINDLWMNNKSQIEDSQPLEGQRWYIPKFNFESCETLTVNEKSTTLLTYQTESGTQEMQINCAKIEYWK